MVKRSDALRGSPSSFETVTRQGVGVSTVSKPSSRTRSTTTRPFATRTLLANARTGMPSTSAIPQPTIPASKSAAWRPVMIRSKSPASRMAWHSFLTVSNGPLDWACESDTRIPASAPMASPRFNAACEPEGPSVISVILVSLMLSRIRSAASIACASKGLVTSDALGKKISCFFTSSTRNSSDGSSGF